MPDNKRYKWDEWYSPFTGARQILFSFPLIEARWFGLRTGYLFLCKNRNGLFFNPSVIEGDKAKRLVISNDEQGNPTVANYVPVIVVATHDNGLIDISFIDTGRVEHGLHPQQRQPMVTHYVDGEPVYKATPTIKGLEKGRVLRLLLFLADSCSWCSFELWRRIPFLGTIGRRRYLRSKYAAGIHKREVKDTFKTYRIGRKERRAWLELWGTIDVNGDNEMDIGEFCTFFDIPFSPLAQRCFELINETKNGKISFSEFIHGMWDCCVMDDQRSKVFWYRLLTKSGRGMEDDVVVDMRDVRHIMRQFYGNESSDVRALMVDISADDDVSGGITYQEWLDFSHAHLLLMYPGFWMQKQLRKKVFGEKYWARMTMQGGRHDGGFRRNRALEKALTAFHEMPVDPDTGKRRFSADFDWDGRRPANEWGKRERAQASAKVMPLMITSGAQEQAREPPGNARIARHIAKFGFW